MPMPDELRMLPPGTGVYSLDEETALEATAATDGRPQLPSAKALAGSAQ